MSLSPSDLAYLASRSRARARRDVKLLVTVGALLVVMAMTLVAAASL